MSGQSRQVLKSYFVTNAIPTQAQFADLIDSFVDMTDDGINVSSLKNIGISDAAPATQLSVKSRPATLTGKLNGNKKDSNIITGSGTLFTKELKVTQAFSVNNSNTYTVSKITSDTSLEINEKLSADFSDATGTIPVDIFSLNDSKGNPLVYTTLDGNTGFGTKNPVSTVEINGKLTARQLAGDGASLTNIQAAAIQGVINKNNLPPFSDVQAPFTINAVSDRQTITGKVTGVAGANKITGNGTSFANELKAGASLEIGTTIYSIKSVDDATNLTIFNTITTPFKDSNANTETRLLSFKNAGGAGVGNADTSGNLILAGNVNALRYIGDGSALSNIQSAKGPFTITSVCDKPITGTVKGTANSNTITGTGTSFLNELKPGACLRINTDIYLIQSIESATSLTIGSTLKSSFSNVTAYMETGMLSLKNAAGINAGNIDTSGNFAITGNIDTSGNCSIAGNVNTNGLLSVTMDDRISGTVTGVKETVFLKGKNTKFKTELAAGSLLKISSYIYIVSFVTTDILLTLTTPLKDNIINDVPAYTPTDTLHLSNNSYPLICTKADSWGNITAPGLITAQSFKGSGSGLTSINAAELVGTIPVECLGPLPPMATSNAGQQIKINLPKATLFDGEPAIVNWTSISCDSLMLEYMNGGQQCTLRTDKDQITLQQNNLSISLIDTTLFTLTAYQGSETQYQQQFWITVIPTIEQRMQQWYSDGYDLLFAMTDVCSRFKLTMLNTENITTVAKAAKLAGYDKAAVATAMPIYYNSRGQHYDPDTYMPVISTAFNE